MDIKDLIEKPTYRRLRGYAFDPITSLNLDTAQINEITYKVPWEDMDDLEDMEERADKKDKQDKIRVVLAGEYIKVIDRDPESDAVYLPINFNDPSILAMDGLTPSETNPQFHQQMVYAVIMTTIKNFERALGRKVMWSNYDGLDSNNKFEWKFVKQLYVYPHAFRGQNAYYSPLKKALCFGYYNATPVKGGSYLPGGIVFSCLSHDIIAHETTHALLDGMYSRYMEVTHPDVGGFHEGFADIVALLQHFTYPEIVRNQLRLSKGALDSENMLVQLASEFGQSIGYHGSLRDAVGEIDPNGKWHLKKASTADYERNLECHERGALLVAAVFDAFITIYKRRTADLMRLATGGTGVFPIGDIHPDLVKRLADEASTTASHVLNICVRALDYCPPVDLHYGDYLRALISADKELVPEDEFGYRIAFINSFRKRGIFPEGVQNLSVETLCYNAVDSQGNKAGFNNHIVEFLRTFKNELAYKTKREEIFKKTMEFIGGDLQTNSKGFHHFLFGPSDSFDQVAFENLTGLMLTPLFKNLGINASTYGKNIPAIEIQSLRILNKTGPEGNIQNQIILSLTQTSRVGVAEDNLGNLKFSKGSGSNKNLEMTFRGGCTLIFDLDDLTLRHAISKPIFLYATRGKESQARSFNSVRLQMQYDCQHGYLKDKIGVALSRDTFEPLAFIHSNKNLIL